MKFKKWLLIFLALPLVACVSQPVKHKATAPVSKSVYAQNKKNHAVVLMDVNWGRWWGCGGRENAQLISLAFDKLPLKSYGNEAEPDLVLHSPSRLMVDPVFTNYAYSIEPGEYALSAFSIKVADSPSKVGFLTAQRDHLFNNGKPAGGTFVAEPGETVFIGNFYLDCAYGPTLWRYYPERHANFNRQLNEYKNKFPFIDMENVMYRLFKTTEFGHDYELPQKP